MIIALEDDLRLRGALTVASNIEFYRYHVSFKVLKGKAWWFSKDDRVGQADEGTARESPLYGRPNR